MIAKKSSNGTWRALLDTKVRSIDSKARTVQFTASSESTDRYGDIIRVAGWDLTAYKKNPVVLWAHKSSEPPVGKTISLSVEMNPPALVQTVQFADAATSARADEIFRLYEGGYLNAVSVGFLPTAEPKMITDETTGRTSGYEFTSQELLEISCVCVPALSDALARAVESGEFSEDVISKLFTRQEDPNEPTEPPEDEPSGSLEDLAEEIGEALDQAQAAYVTLLARIQGGTQTPPAAGAAAIVPVQKTGIEALLEQLVAKP